MKNNDFEYKYSAPTSAERKEIESIRNSYLIEKSPNKHEQLRKLDRKVRNLPTAFSLIVGILGLLLLGLGFSMILEWKIYLWGIVVSCIGLIAISLAYPIYFKTSNYLKSKYSEQILKLSEELLNEKNK